MPGRTLETWYGSGGEPSEGNYPSESPFHPRQSQLQPEQYEAHHYDPNYYYPNANVNQTPAVSAENSSNYPQQYSPASPSTTNYYSNQSQSSHHEMSYPNPQGAYNPASGHYGPPNHAQNSNYPASGNPWNPQQAPADYTHHAVSGTPSATPAPAHTPSSASSINPPPPVMAGQYPAHTRHPPISGTPPSWNHPPQQVGTTPYYPPPRGIPPGPPQHAHMASDRHSPHATWNNNTAVPKTPPATHHQNSPGAGNPLFSLQMLVNQDMNRATQVASYRGTPTSTLPETVDLSSTNRASPIPLTRSDKAPEHSAIRNGGIATSTITSLPGRPVNGGDSPSSRSGNAPEPKQSSDEVSVIIQSPAQGRATNLVAQSLEKKLESRDLRDDSVDGKAPPRNDPQADNSLVCKEDSLSVPVNVFGATSSPVRSPKSSFKRAKKVDLILENLVESGSIKLPSDNAIPTQVTAPSVIVSREVAVADIVPLEIQLPSPSSHKPERKSPAGEDISPTGGDDDSGKPRRKRKLDKPLRLSKTDEAIGGKVSEVEASDLKVEASDVKVEASDVKVEAAEAVVVSINAVNSEESRNDDANVSRRRSSSECSEPSLRSVEKRSRRKSESDQSERDAEQKPAAPLPAIRNTFTEVENELEKMFAGMDECSNEPAHVVKSEEVPSTSGSVEACPPSTSTPNKAQKRDKRGRPKGSKNEPKSSDSVNEPSSSERTSKKKSKSKKSGELTPSSKKKRKGTKLFPEDQAKARESFRDDSGSNASTGKIRGPLIRVQGAKENPDSVVVYNAPSQAEEGERQMKMPVPSGRRKNSTYHSDLDYRGKVGSSGMFSSTLSARYDAHTTDRTWLCVFCKCGPHSNTGQATLANGDLFGPYIVSREPVDNRGLGFVDSVADDRDINAEQKKGGRNKKSLRLTDTVEQFRHRMSKKAKRAQSMEIAAAPGLVAIAPDSARGEPCFEIWVHEDCALWASGTRIVGSRIYGLQDAVWAAVPIICNKCGLGGANIVCITRNCRLRVHFNCAQLLDWDLDESTYIARCSHHRIKREAGASN